MDTTTIISRVTRKNAEKIAEIIRFLQANNLDIDPHVTDFVVIYQQDEIVACGGVDGDIIKCIAVSRHLRGQGVLLKLVTELINIAMENGNSTLFVYTRSHNERLFIDCGFTTLVSIPGCMVLMENSGSRLTRYLQKLAQLRKPGNRIAAIVMNANPFTNGHLHLIRYASDHFDWLHLFLVNEDAAQFPFTDRLALVQDATQRMTKLTVHPGSQYMISRATFPAYFLKEQPLVERCYTQIDITLFRQYIAPVLGITHRIVGNEPFCPITARYNQDMRHWLSTPALPFAPVELVEISRLQWQGTPVSASRVRRLLQQNRLSEVAPLVPDTTLRYLKRHQKTDLASMTTTPTGAL
ncbi:TPA: [citrate (pro-3S)-lyase] ligase [Klebsiella oxytoca]|uniref:[citrate (pro-3S)-lyase] ligase n=1 Tax=Klebsiella oxytoca TaxID=571 RepID=UPI0002500051|nr:[citrate (pro-3S)-lyase] ligase [Klebsiella oxytoca]EHS89023.1 [citrate (Pro-3S)-lyase] ligase [Klebsiella oxytoca 10-5245]HAT3721244.1 [citrate (pro-3S)-lyase] ligase [Klebsiella oxytoca]HBL6845630.1 [citrate (pro-3S)-lyase] ligase [Klebsiella oxytoca]HBM3153897.1 [citrate (pro-3S)-lyase] ligase [Klebsiella oxytoca]HCJ0414344.1 [citrate (pro-3S)-lyase] ligase [Klebsiella oxytoca]